MFEPSAMICMAISVWQVEEASPTYLELSRTETLVKVSTFTCHSNLPMFDVRGLRDSSRGLLDTFIWTEWLHRKDAFVLGIHCTRSGLLQQNSLTDE
jgi:hypothetical protein